MSNSTSCGSLGDEFCAVVYGVVASMIYLLCYSCTRGCSLASKHRANNLKYVKGKLPKEKVTDPSEYDSPCAVCIETFIDNDYICKLSCGHYYHPDCIYHWVLQKNVCPLCKVRVVSGLQNY